MFKGKAASAGPKALPLNMALTGSAMFLPVAVIAVRCKGIELLQHIADRIVPGVVDGDEVLVCTPEGAQGVGKLSGAANQ